MESGVTILLRIRTGGRYFNKIIEGVIIYQREPVFNRKRGHFIHRTFTGDLYIFFVTPALKAIKNHPPDPTTSVSRKIKAKSRIRQKC